MPSRANPLRSLRLKLTLWYLLTLCAIIALLGGGLFLAISRRFTLDLNESLRSATAQLMRAAETRELEAAVRGQVVDAVEELHISDRTLYLLDSTGAPVTPAAAPDWILAALHRPHAAPVIDLRHREGPERVLVLHAEMFMLSSGHRMIAAAVADRIEVEDRYAKLIAAFSAAAAFAIVMVAIGGWLLVRQATAPIEHSMDRMRRFMADAAHELRTPITVLRTQAEVALQQDRSEQGYVDALRGIESEGRRLGRIVDDLLTLARADSGERPLAFARTFLDDVVADAVGAAGAMATARRVTLALGRFEEAPVQGDPELLRQLVMILLDNALKFTPAGGSVDASVGWTAAGAFFSVTDTGPGIIADQLPRIFERFFRGDPARTREGHNAVNASGAGLGLSIALWIADAHRAVIDVTSNVGSGTKVSVRFPPPDESQL